LQHGTNGKTRVMTSPAPAAGLCRQFSLDVPAILVQDERVGVGGASMGTEVKCKCGAVYERTEEKVIFRDQDSFQCRLCGETLETWSSSRIPVFRLIKEPEE
jgi:hypothetical protein